MYNKDTVEQDNTANCITLTGVQYFLPINSVFIL